jgi:calcium-dependent protein kinase
MPVTTQPPFTKAVQIYACKMIIKKLDLPGVTEIQQQRHIDNIQREVTVLKRLRGSLSVVQLTAVYEDEGCVYLVMERCTGGELWRPRGQRDHTEQAVCAVL